MYSSGISFSSDELPSFLITLFPMSVIATESFCKTFFLSVTAFLNHLRKNKKGLRKDFQDIFPELKRNDFRRNWARLIQKIYEVDPLICPMCQGAMRVIGSIEDPSVIRAILEHLGYGWQEPGRRRKSMTRMSA